LANIFCKYLKATKSEFFEKYFFIKKVLIKDISDATRNQTYEDVIYDERSSDDENDIDMFMLEYSFTLPEPGKLNLSTELT
jgi:hypothetical protein